MTKISDLDAAMKEAAMDARVMTVAKAFHRRAQKEGRESHTWENAHPSYRSEVLEVVRFTLEAVDA
jgi:hypothetical protein